LKEYIQKLLEIDKEEIKLKDYMNKLKEKKNKLNTSVIYFIEQNNIQDKDIVFGDKKIKYALTKNQENITKGLIFEKLKVFLKNEDTAKEAVQFIYSDRNSTTKPTIKIIDIKNKGN
jgi:hypothetical protein